MRNEGGPSTSITALPHSLGRREAKDEPRSFITDRRVLPVVRVLRDPTVRQSSLITPIVRLFGLPRPLEPPSTLLVRDGLGLPIPPKELLVILGEF